MGRKIKKRLSVFMAVCLIAQMTMFYMPGGNGIQTGDVQYSISVQEIQAFAEDTGTPTPTDTTTPTPTDTTSPTPTDTTTPTPTDTPTPTPWWGDGTAPEFFMIKESQPIPNGKLMDMTSMEETISIGNSAGVFPADATIQWESYNPAVIQIEPKMEGTKYTVKLKAVGPGYTSLGAVVTYGGVEYTVNCQLHVPLKLKATSGDVNGADNGYGMIDSLKAGETTENKVIQLSLEDAAHSHYLPIFQYIDYAADAAYPSGIDSWVDKANYNGSKLIEDGKVPALEWTTSDSSVVVVDQYGYVTAVGAGYAEITVSTMTTADNSKGDSKTIGVLVTPAVQLPGRPSMETGTVYFTAPSPSVTIYTNAVIADTLEYSLYQCSAANFSSSTLDTEIDLNNNKFMNVSISNIGNGLILSEMKAGVYCLVIRPTDQYSAVNPKVKKVLLEITVPIMISEAPVVMNVNDTYNVLNSANILDKSLFTYNIDNENIAQISNGIVTALAEGFTYIRLHYQPSKDVFDGMTIDNDGNPIYKMEYVIPLTVIDGIFLNTTNATIAINSTLQLRLITSNNTAPITWKVDDESIISVDDDGLVTGLKEGNAIVTVTQVINGVTKTARCNVRVVGTVTNITLDPPEKTLAVGDLLTINAKVEPKLNQVDLSWVTSDESIVTIEQSGALSATVKAQKGGVAVVTAINQDNVVVGSCLITVEQSIEKITLSQTSVTIPLVDKNFILFATISPKEAQESKLVWKSSDPTILTVDQSGYVTLKKAGVASVICSSAGDSNIMAICNVTVTKSVTGVKLDQTTLSMFVGEAYRLSYIVTPNDASDVAVTWLSTNTSVATVDANGLVSAKSVGQAVMILKTVDGGYISTCIVNVGRTATAVKLDVNALTLNVGDYYYFETTITPADSTDAALTWETSDKSVAIISNKGKVTAKKAGVTVIMAKTKSGSTAYCTVTVQQGVTSVVLSSKEENIRVEDEVELTATVNPKNATVQDITWTSSNPKVASVDERGRVTGVGEGVAIITVTTEDGGYVDYCAVIVKPKEIFVEEITMKPEYMELAVGVIYKLEAVITPAKVTYPTLTWASSDESIVTVDKRGRIKGIAPGDAIVTVSATDGSGVEAFCDVEVVYKTELTIAPESIMLGVNKSEKLTATVLPEELTNKQVTWKSSNSKIVKVDTNGKITGVNPGKAIITCSTTDGSNIEAYCEVEVVQLITDIALNYDYLKMIKGETKSLVAMPYPENATYGVTWESADPSIAVVNKQNGKVTAVKAGTTTITAKAKDNSGITAICYIEVINPIPISNIQLSESELIMTPGETTTVTYTILPSNYTDTFSWSSDNPVVASVDSKTGKITANSMGTANITIFASSGKSASVKIYVVGLSKTNLELQQYTSTIISLEVFGASKSDLQVKWYSDNERIAEIAGGKITGRAIGTTYVYAVVNGRKLACRVNVSKITNR